MAQNINVLASRISIGEKIADLEQRLKRDDLTPFQRRFTEKTLTELKNQTKQHLEYRAGRA